MAKETYNTEKETDEVLCAECFLVGIWNVDFGGKARTDDF